MVNQKLIYVLITHINGIFVMSTNDIDMHTSSIPPKYEEVTSDINPIMFQLQLAQKASLGQMLN